MFFFIARQARSSDAAVRKRAAEKLAAAGRARSHDGPVPRHVALLLELLNDSDADVRVTAYGSLARAGDARAAAGMAVGLKDIEKLGDPAATAIRDAAVGAFEGIGTDAVPALLELAKDKSPRIREVAVAALGGIGGPDAERTVVAALQDSRSSVRQAAIQALARTAAAGSVASLSAALGHRDPATRRSAIEAMTGVAGSEATRALRRLTTDPDRGVREAAVRGLAKQGSPDAVDALLSVFQGSDRDLRQIAVGALKDLDWQPVTSSQRALRAVIAGDYHAAAAEGEAAVEPLTALMTEKSAAVRTAVAQALGETGQAAAVPPLVAALHDPDAGARQAAADALVRIGAPSIGPLVSAAHEAARTAAAEIVSHVGAPAATPLLDVLEQGEPYEREGVRLRRVADENEAEQAARVAQLLNRLIGQAAASLDVQPLRRVTHLWDVVTVREVMPASRRDSPTMIVDVVVDCKELRSRASAELERRKP